MKQWMLILAMAALPGLAIAGTYSKPDMSGGLPVLREVLPQDRPLISTPAVIASDSTQLQDARVEVELGLGEQNPRWQLSQTMLQLLGNQLADVVMAQPQPGDALVGSVKNPDASYRGLRLTVRRVDGRAYAPLLVRNGAMYAQEGGPQAVGMKVSDDPGRRFEYWLFGTARIRRDLVLGSALMPVVTFEQCRILGNMIVDTEPRQCLLPDQNILLETPEPLTRASLQAHDFNSCLLHGQALIYSFPRRCMAAGGRVFTEPPQVYEDETSGTMPKLITQGPAAPGSLAPTPMLGTSATLPMAVVPPMKADPSVWADTDVSGSKVSRTVVAPPQRMVSATVVSTTVVSPTRPLAVVGGVIQNVSATTDVSHSLSIGGNPAAGWVAISTTVAKTMAVSTTVKP